MRNFLTAILILALAGFASAQTSSTAAKPATANHPTRRYYSGSTPTRPGHL